MLDLFVSLMEMKQDQVEFLESRSAYLLKQIIPVTWDPRAGNEWKQISKCGYFRLCDEYFWPSDPRHPAVEGSMVTNQYPPTIEEIKQLRSNY